MNEKEFWEYAQIEEINKHILQGNALVTVWCPTYNHENYIRETLDGFVSQETDFAFQVLIYDDASNDNTAEIVREYAERFPEVFHVFLAGRNIYWHPYRERFITKLLKKNVVGKYVAICEGDDCWIDPYKLQIQVDYMESHPACSLYMHNSIKINYHDSLEITTQNSYKCVDEKDLSCEEVIMQYRHHPATASMLLKKDLFFMPESMERFPAMDYTIQLNCMANGDVHYSNRIMSIYRFYTEGSYTKIICDDRNSWLKFYITLVMFLSQFDQYTSSKYHEWLNRQMQRWALSVINGFENGLAEHIRELNQQGILITDEDQNIINELITLDKQIKDQQFVRNELMEFIKRYQNIVIMGTGNYSDKLSDQLEYNHIDFSGYAVSRLEEYRKFRGKRVWQLDQINKEFDEVGVVVAIKPLRWEELVKSLETAGIKNYYCPFRL